MERKTNLTSTQQNAVAAKGNVLIMAGAGTGKTHTLVERCLKLICEEKVSLTELLIVTFTEAAAAEMRERLRTALENYAPTGAVDRVAEQLALFDAAHIGTLHSFCFKLVREHFHELALDPQLTVLDEGQARLLCDEILDEQFQAHYENEDAFSLSVQDLIRIYGSGRDENLRALVLRLHHYIQTRADAESWLQEQVNHFSSGEPVQWRDWYAGAVANWRAEWLPLLANLGAANEKAGECLKALEKLPAGAMPDACRQAFQDVLAADVDYPARKKTILRKPLEDFFEDAAFLSSLAPTDKADPLREDWDWVRGPMKTLLLLTKEFSEKFAARKRTDGVVDFHDLEQFAIRLLWNLETGQPSAIAEQWRARLRFVCVDEYQDINAAQDKIISALGRENRFLVGDVKQSIYRFRLADPKIFRDYAKTPDQWSGGAISLNENFRSRELILDFINSLFAPLMREDVGGILYDDAAKLKFGSRETRGELSSAQNPEPRVELLLRTKARGDNTNADGGDAPADLHETEKEARMVALELRALKNSGHEIWEDGKFRAAEWSDFAVLLRSPGSKAEIFAKQFVLAGVPLLVERGGFYDSSEISDLLSLLQLADNPLQDVPCIAVLRSPLVGCTVDELAEIRLAGHGHFWFALNQAAQKAAIGNETRAKLEKFLKRFSRWRKLAQQASLSQCLEAILSETHYDVWLLSRPRGAQRRANVQRFLNLAEQFDAFQRQGLFRFLKFVEAQREIEAEPDVAPVAEENAVRLMSIHQSKGLEFPIVAVADLGKTFNEQDLRGEIILDERFGLCSRVKPPSSGGRYPSLAYWLAQKNQRRELRGEELRLLYVALTRARDTLILSGSISEKKGEQFFEANAAVTPAGILSARSCLDWLGLWFQAQAATARIEKAGEGQLPLLRWRFVDDAALTEIVATPEQRDVLGGDSLDPGTAEKLRNVLAWQYPFVTASQRAAKTSVTALRRQAADTLAEEAEQKFPAARSRFKSQRTVPAKASRLSAADTGVAHHKFLQHFVLERAIDQKSFTAEAKRLAAENYLSADEAAVLDIPALAEFWDSDIGKKMRAQSAFLQRELPFTAAFSPAEVDGLLGKKTAAETAEEFIIVQGVADLTALLPKEIWLVDFKTDEVRAGDLPDKIKRYAPQLKLYARALEKIYSRPVTNCWLHFFAAGKTVEVSAAQLI